MLIYTNIFINVVWDTRDSPKIGSVIMNDGVGSGLNELFRDEGLLGMIEGKEMKNLENISHFMETLVERACEEAHTAPIKSVLRCMTSSCRA